MHFLCRLEKQPDQGSFINERAELSGGSLDSVAGAGAGAATAGILGGGAHFADDLDYGVTVLECDRV